MLIQTTCERMVVISDLHIGNPFSNAKRQLASFLDYCNEENLAVCVNGDGLEILQASFRTLAMDTIGLMGTIRRYLADGLPFYYVVGNHDIALERILESAAATAICPFLNVTSGGRRIHIEHGHLYDPSFVKHPIIYEWMTRAAGPMLTLYPDIYQLWNKYQSLKDRLTRKRARDDLDASVYYEAADRILKRGFDAVIFGHTHAAELVSMGDDQLYANSGTWMDGFTYVEINQGKLRLCKWNGVGPTVIG